MNKISHFYNMIGASGVISDAIGNKVLLAPSGEREKMRYINISNTTENSISVFLPTQDPLVDNPVLTIGKYMRFSFSAERFTNGIVIAFTSPTPTIVKQLEVVWSVESLMWNQSFATSYSVSTSGNVVITDPLSAGGNLQVSIEESIPLNVVDTASDIFVSQEVAANTVNTVILPGIVGKRYILDAYEIQVSGSAVSVVTTISLYDDATLIWRENMNVGVAANVFRTFPRGLKITADKPLTLEVSAGGVGCITRINLAGRSI